MRLLIVSTMYGHVWGGSEVLWWKIAKLALEKNVEVVVVRHGHFHSEHENITFLREKGAKIYNREQGRNHIEPRRFYLRAMDKLLKKPKAQPRYIDSFQEIKEKFNPDAILVSTGHTYEVAYDVPLLHYLEGTGKAYNVLSQYHEEYGVVSESQKKKIADTLHGAKQVFFVSNRNKQVVERQLVTKFSNYKIISNPVNLNKLEILVHPNTDCINFACVGRLEAFIKGQDVLLEILAQPVWKERSWKLNFYGQGADEAHLKALAHFYGLSDRVTFHGQVKDIKNIWEHNHILLFPSHGEGTPLSLMEAMACGRTAVATDVGGIEDCIIEDKTGFLADWGSVRSFGRAMENAWHKQHQWDEMGKNAHYHVLERFDMNSHETILELL